MLHTIDSGGIRLRPSPSQQTASPLRRLALAGAVCLAGTFAARAWTDALPTSDRNLEALRRAESPPLGLPGLRIPPESPLTIARIELGRLLFSDPRLSAGDTLACSSCHVPEQGFAQTDRSTPSGAGGATHRRNAPTILNAALEAFLFHDGRATTLEEQVLLSLLDAREMANASLGEVEAKFQGIRGYEPHFQSAFGGAPTAGRIAQAIASWERTLLAGNSRFDSWMYAGGDSALTDEEQRGFALFTGKGRCGSCHLVGETHGSLSDDLFHDTGVGYLRDPSRPRSTPLLLGAREPDYGRMEVTGDTLDKWRFRTPSLRNVAVTPPYMHDGSLATLEDVVRFYVLGGAPHPGIDPLMGPVDLTEEEQRSLVAFLRSLTSENLGELEADAGSSRPPE